jgi:hypothetical protein
VPAAEPATPAKGLPRALVYVLFALVGVAVIVGAGLGAYRIARRASQPMAPVVASAPAPRTPAAPPPAATPAAPTARPAAAAPGMAPECREYLKALECLQRGMPHGTRDNVMNKAKEELKHESAEYCRMQLAGIAASPRNRGCAR